MSSQPGPSRTSRPLRERNQGLAGGDGYSSDTGTPSQMNLFRGRLDGLLLAVALPSGLSIDPPGFAILAIGQSRPRRRSRYQSAIAQRSWSRARRAATRTRSAPISPAPTRRRSIAASPTCSATGMYKKVVGEESTATGRRERRRGRPHHQPRRFRRRATSSRASNLPSRSSPRRAFRVRRGDREGRRRSHQGRLQESWATTP